MTVLRHFVENREGVHLMMGEFTLCGDAHDIQDVEPDHDGFRQTEKRIVSCERCVDIIKTCRGVRTSSG